MTNEIITFGCRLNIYESEIIRKNLALAELDNVIVINTCSVTEEAEKEAIRAIRKIKRTNPESKIIVTGCAAQLKKDFFGGMPEVSKVLGNEEKLSHHHYKLDESKIVVSNIMSVKETAGHLVDSFNGKSRAFVQVQNGCNHRCSFCIIPYTRGRSRSVPIGVIVTQIKHLVEQGFNEVTFTGVDITGYGSDLPGKPTLGQMINRVLRLVPELKRLRLSSIDVAEIDEELFELMSFEKRLMPHFHISLQSGDNMILKLMKRRHKRERVIDFCHKLREKRYNTAFGADIIVGFPTENENMFFNTVKLITEADLQYLHVFPYSIRKGTPAAEMLQVDNKIKKTRVKILKELGLQQMHKFFKKNIGEHVELLVEGSNSAHSENFIPVVLYNKLNNNINQLDMAGQIIKARLSGIEHNHMLVENISYE